MTDFAPYIVAVATELWGAPRPGATKTEVRFGDGRTVNPTKGSWWSHGEEVGGGVLDLVSRETGRKGRDAVEWLRARGFHVDDDPAAAPRQAAPVDRAERSPPAKKEEPNDGASKVLVKSWDYLDEAGAVLFQTQRYQWKLPDGSWRKGKDGKATKSYSQRRRAEPGEESRDGWIYSLRGARIVPYALPDLAAAISDGMTVFFVEGEKAADALRSIGVPTTCNPMGAGKWWEELTGHFVGANVIVIPDNDPQATNDDGKPLFHPDGRPKLAGQDHAQRVAQELHKVAASVTVLELPDLALKADAADWVEAGGTADQLYDLADAARPWRPVAAPYKSLFGAVPWSDIAAAGPQHEWLIKGLMTRGELGMLAGPSQSGKSFLAIDLAMCIARGVDWFGRKVRRGGVVYQAGESARGVRRKRLPAYRQHHGLNWEDDIPFVMLSQPVNLYASEDQTSALISEIKHLSQRFTVPLELVVIDTYAAATPGADENSAKDMTTVLSRCQKIAEAASASVLLVHHMNAGGEKPRGHTSIFANLDSVLICKKVEASQDADRRQVREMSVAKAKDGEDSASFKFVLRGVEIGRDEDGDPITSCVVDLPNRGLEVEAGPPGGIKASAQAVIFLRAMEAAIGAHGVEPPSEIRLPPYHKVVEWGFVRAEFDRRTFEGDDEDDPERRKARITKALQRHGETLMKNQVIGRQKVDGRAFVWLTGRRVAGFGGAAQISDMSDGPPLPPDDDPFSNVLEFPKLS